MSIVRDTRIREFQQQAGIKPAAGEEAEILGSMSKAAASLIEIIALERSGIRDGDGHWSGCDPLEESIRNLTEFCGRLRR